MATTINSSPFFAEWTLKDCRRAKSNKLPAPHQTKALTGLRNWYEKLNGEDDGGILVLPTGAGKTFTAVHFLCNGPLGDGYKVLWLAHTHHLLEQAFHAFSADALRNVREPRDSLRVRVVSGTPGHSPPRDIRAGDDVVIATLQTITNANREKLKALEDFVESAAGKLFVIFDEAHHSPAPSYRKLVLDLRGNGAPTLGLTATPTYSDERKQGWLKKLFPQGIIAQARASDLIASGVLAKPHFERAPTSVVPDFDEADYQKWLGTYGDIPENVIEHLARNAERNAVIAQSYVRNREKYGKTIIFTDRWYQCESIVEALRKLNVKADAVYSHVDTKIATVEGRAKRGPTENALALERFRKNEIDVLVNVRMLTEGTDIPDAQTVFLTRQTTSQILLTQMVGRALRGPKFGGTSDAYIVSFIDDWQQAIRWAEYDPLTVEGADDGVPVSPKRPPLQLISIDLVKRLARQMDTGANVAPGPFTSLMPVGWYRVTFAACLNDSDEIQSCDQLVMVFEDEKKGFEAFIGSLLKGAPAIFEDEAVSFEKEKSQLEAWRQKHVGASSRSTGDLLRDLFHIARHVGQGHGMPEFHPFDVRDDHDLDVVVRAFLQRRLDSKAIRDGLRAEYEKKDRFWRVLFPRFEQLRSYYHACEARILDEEEGLGPAVEPGREPPSGTTEPTEEVKEQVKGRDGGRCLACGSTKHLQVDHIVAVYRGGPNHLDNLQTLCKKCNLRKAKRTVRFTSQQTQIRSLAGLEHFDDPHDAGDREHWERFLRGTLNFSYQCGAVSKVSIGGRGDGYYNWSIELFPGNSPGLLKPHLAGLVGRVQASRERAGKPAITSLSIHAPGEDAVSWPSTP